MADEPRFSSNQNPLVSNHELDTARFEQVNDLNMIDLAVQNVELERLEVDPPESQYILIVALFMSIFSLCMLLIYFMGEATLFYQFIYGEGGAHLISQMCTFALFCWGMSLALVRIKNIRYEKSLLTTAIKNGGQPLLTLNKSILGLFTKDIIWGAQQVQGYLAGRTVLDEARGRLIDRLELGLQGIKAAMWLIPLSGFLGTVIGMSLTIGRFDELFLGASGDHVKILGLTDLAPAIQGLGTAFDTTLLALALVIPLKLALVYLESQSETLVEGAEMNLAEPYLSRCLGTDSASSSDFTRLEIQDKIQRLTEQSDQLNQVLNETSTYLLDLRNSLMSHPALSKKAQDDLMDTVRLTLQAKHSSGDSSQQEQLIKLLNELVQYQGQLGHRLSQLQDSVDAPILLQRAPTHTRES